MLSSSWTRGSLRCIYLHNENWFVQRVIVFLSSFVYAGLDFLWTNRQVFLEKQQRAEDACLTGAPGPCSQFLVKSELIIYFCYFVCIILVTLCTLLCLFVFNVGPLSLDYIFLISARILITWILLFWKIYTFYRKINVGFALVLVSQYIFISTNCHRVTCSDLSI